MRVLLVEDDPTLAEGIAEFLRGQGDEVTTENDGMQADRHRFGEGGEPDLTVVSPVGLGQGTHSNLSGLAHDGSQSRPPDMTQPAAVVERAVGRRGGCLLRGRRRIAVHTGRPRADAAWSARSRRNHSARKGARHTRWCW